MQCAMWKLHFCCLCWPILSVSVPFSSISRRTSIQETSRVSGISLYSWGESLFPFIPFNCVHYIFFSGMFWLQCPRKTKDCTITANEGLYNTVQMFNFFLEILWKTRKAITQEQTRSNGGESWPKVAVKISYLTYLTWQTLYRSR
jgi:hypothetical protein